MPTEWTFATIDCDAPLATYTAVEIGAPSWAALPAALASLPAVTWEHAAAEAFVAAHPELTAYYLLRIRVAGAVVFALRWQPHHPNEEASP